MEPAPISPEELAATERVCRLLDVPRTERAGDWRERLDADLPDALFAPGPSFRSPDLFPYVTFERLPPDPRGTEVFSIRRHAEAVLDAFNGVVIASRETGVSPPDLVLSFGALAAWRMFGAFASPLGWAGSRAAEGAESEILDQGEMVEAGAPNIEFLPVFVRTALGEYLRAQGVARPRALLLLRPNGDRALAFNLIPGEAPNFISTPEARGMTLQRALWYLPPGYRVFGGSETTAEEIGAELLPPTSPGLFDEEV